MIKPLKCGIIILYQFYVKNNLRNYKDGTLIRIFNGHTNSVHAVVQISGTNYIISGGHDYTVRVWYKFFFQ